MSGKQREINKCKDQLTMMLKTADNKFCADCGAAHPTWTSTNLGVFICIRCSGIHRHMSTEYSFVKSITLDSWNYMLLEKFKECGGNKTVNSFYEAKLTNKSLKPTEHSDNYTVEQYIRAKYIDKKYYSPRPKNLKRSKSKTKKKSRRKSSSDEESSSSPQRKPLRSRSVKSQPKTKPKIKSKLVQKKIDLIPQKKPSPKPQSVDLIPADQWSLFSNKNVVKPIDSFLPPILNDTSDAQIKKARNSIMEKFQEKPKPVLNNDSKFYTRQNAGIPNPQMYTGAEMQMMQFQPCIPNQMQSMMNQQPMQGMNGLQGNMVNGMRLNNAMSNPLGNGSLISKPLSSAKSVPPKKNPSWVGFDQGKGHTSALSASKMNNLINNGNIFEQKNQSKQNIMNIFQTQSKKNTMMTGANKPVPNNAFMTQLRPVQQTQPMMNGYVQGYGNNGYINNNVQRNQMMMNVGNGNMQMNNSYVMYQQPQMQMHSKVAKPVQISNVPYYNTRSANTKPELFSQFQIN